MLKEGQTNIQTEVVLPLDLAERTIVRLDCSQMDWTPPSPGVTGSVYGIDLKTFIPKKPLPNPRTEPDSDEDDTLDIIIEQK